MNFLSGIGNGLGNIAQKSVETGENTVNVAKQVTGTVGNSVEVGANAAKVGANLTKTTGEIAVDLTGKSGVLASNTIGTITDVAKSASGIATQFSSYGNVVGKVLTDSLGFPAAALSRQIELKNATAIAQAKIKSENVTIDVLKQNMEKQYNEIYYLILNSLNKNQKEIDDMKHLGCEKVYWYSNCTPDEQILRTKLSNVRYDTIDLKIQMNKLKSTFGIKIKSENDEVKLKKIYEEEVQKINNINAANDENYEIVVKTLRNILLNSQTPVDSDVMLYNNMNKVPQGGSRRRRRTRRRSTTKKSKRKSMKKKSKLSRRKRR